MLSGRRTLFALALAALLGLGYWVWTKQIQPGRIKAKEDAKLLFPGAGVEQTSRILLRKKGSPDVALQKNAGDWRLTSPIQAPADAEAVKVLVQELSRARNDETVLETGADPREFGLDEPSGAVTFQPNSPGAKAQALFFGSDNPLGTHTYAMVDGKPAVFLTRMFLKNAVLQDADGLREKRIWDFEAQDVERVQMQGLKIEKDKDGRWWVTGQGRREWSKVDAQKSWLQALSSLRAEKVPSEDGRGPYGLMGKGKLELELKGGKKLFLILGNMTKDKGLYVQGGGRGPVFELSEVTAKIIQKEPKALMDLAAFQLDPFAVDKVVVDQKGVKLKAEKVNGSWQWTPALLDKGGLDPAELCKRFSDCELLSRLGEKDRSASLSVKVSFFNGAGEELESVQLGGKRDGGQLATSKRLRQAVLVPPGLLRGIPDLIGAKP